MVYNYNIPSNNRELQPVLTFLRSFSYYNIPSNNRELQPLSNKSVIFIHYNIPSNNRELQHTYGMYFTYPIITYQVITGNYSSHPGIRRQQKL